MDHILSLHSSVKGTWVAKYLLATVSNVMNTGRQTSVCLPGFNPSGCAPRSGTAGSFGNPGFNSLRNRQHCFPQRLRHFHILTSRAQGPSFSAASPTLVIFWVLILATQRMCHTSFMSGNFIFLYYVSYKVERIE